MRTDLFDFELPPERIALRPASPRDSARMLVVQPDGVLRDACRLRSAEMARAGRPARRQRHQGDLGAAQRPPHRPRDRAEDRGDPDQAARRLALAGAGQAGEEACEPATASASAMRAGSACSAISTPRSRHKGGEGEVTLSFTFHGPTLDQAIADLGSPPLPPYIAGKRAPDERDLDDYQTMFAQDEGAVAAPTAGLHFTPALEAALRARGVGLHRLTLHVGAGTFLPVKVDDTEGHRMHAEWGSLTPRPPAR